MADLLEKAARWALTRRGAWIARPVAYTRGPATATLLATVGRTAFKVASGHGGSIRVESRDYLVAASELVLDGARTEPRRGDRITETLDGRTIECEVLAPGDEPHFRYSDPFRLTLRIHTKVIGETGD